MRNVFIWCVDSRNKPMIQFNQYAKIKVLEFLALFFIWENVGRFHPLFLMKGIEDALKMGKIGLECEICKQRNYTTTKSTDQQATRVELKKFCSRCNKHTIHRETK